MNTISSEIKQSLETLLELHNISIAELCRRANISQPTLSRLLAGSTDDPRASTLSAIAKYFDISVDQLIGLKPMPKTLNDKKTAAETMVFIPLLSWEDTATQTFHFDKKQQNNHRQWIETESFNKNCFSIKVSDDSMWPQFIEGTILIVNPSLKPKNRDFVICYLKKEKEVVFRQYIDENGNGILKAINQSLPHIKINKNDKIIGVITQARNDFKIS